MEVCYDFQFGTVCDDNWDSDDATVVCNQLGYSYTGGERRIFVCDWIVAINYFISTAGEAVGGAAFGAGSGPIFLDDVQCTSSESSLLSCSSNPIGSNDCVHSQDAGVICEGTTLALPIE